MYAKHIYLYSYESPESTLPERKKIIQIELLDVKILTIKVKVKNKYIERNYSTTCDSIHAIFGLWIALDFLFLMNINSFV